MRSRADVEREISRTHDDLDQMRRDAREAEELLDELEAERDGELMKFYAVDPVSNRLLSVRLADGRLEGLFGSVALSARILIEPGSVRLRGGWREAVGLLEKLGYRNVGSTAGVEKADGEQKRTRRAGKAG